MASMGPRLGRVEYYPRTLMLTDTGRASMGPRLGRVEYYQINIGSTEE